MKVFFLGDLKINDEEKEMSRQELSLIGRKWQERGK